MTRSLRCRRLWPTAAVMILLTLVYPARPSGQQSTPAQPQRPTFGSSVDLVLVHATVTDSEGFFVRGLKQQDFEVLEDGKPQAITAFSSERVPVSIGIAIDLSNSMRGEKLRAAKAALSRLLDELLDAEDEIFLYSFNDEPTLLQGWTTKRDLLRKAIERLRTRGLTALYDTASQAVKMAATGKHRKKALVIVSDGSDTASHTDLRALKEQIRESEVLVYAIGIDARAAVRQGEGVPAPTTGDAVLAVAAAALPQFPPRPPVGGPSWPPVPRGPGGGRRPPPPPPHAPIPPTDDQWVESEVDALALRALTDDSGGRTAIVRSASDLGPATAGIADELSRQYFLGYQGAAPRDGQWHSIDVVVRRPDLRVRARSGYVAGK